MKSSRRRAPADPLADPDVPKGMSLALLQELHLLTRDGQLNQDARRKLKQIRHFVGLLRPALDDVYARHAEPTVVDCGAGKSYLGSLLYELELGPRGRGRLCAVEVRAELVEAARARAARFGHARFAFAAAEIGEVSAGAGAAANGDGDEDEDDAALPERLHVVTALHACDTATDDAIALAVRRQADYVAVVPCCQAEVARQLAAAPRREPLHALFRHALHRREFGSHLTNVVRALALQAHGYQVTVTELVGWEHSAKNELLLARRVARRDDHAALELAELCARFAIEPSLVRQLAAAAT
ncbi:MAG: SAM-dependent methyltransferase [Kofleriaceae bacterium]